MVCLPAELMFATLMRYCTESDFFFFDRWVKRSKPGLITCQRYMWVNIHYFLIPFSYAVEAPSLYMYLSKVGRRFTSASQVERANTVFKSNVPVSGRPISDTSPRTETHTSWEPNKELVRQRKPMKQPRILGYLLKTRNHVKPSWETMNIGERVYPPRNT